MWKVNWLKYLKIVEKENNYNLADQFPFNSISKNEVDKNSTVIKEDFVVYIWY